MGGTGVSAALLLIERVREGVTATVTLHRRDANLKLVPSCIGGCGVTSRRVTILHRLKIDLQLIYSTFNPICLKAGQGMVALPSLA